MDVWVRLNARLDSPTQFHLHSAGVFLTLNAISQALLEILPFGFLFRDQIARAEKESWAFQLAKRATAPACWQPPAAHREGDSSSLAEAGPHASANTTALGSSPGN